MILIMILLKNIVDVSLFNNYIFYLKMHNIFYLILLFKLNIKLVYNKIKNYSLLNEINI